MRISTRFWEKQNCSRFNDLLFSYQALNVGYSGHQHRNKKMFDKWYNIPNKGHRLFWRLHAFYI